MALLSDTVRRLVAIGLCGRSTRQNRVRTAERRAGTVHPHAPSLPLGSHRRVVQMINLSASAEDAELSELARSVGVKVLEPAARAAEIGGRYPEDVWAKLAATGLAGGYLDGGADSIPTAAAHVRIVESLAYGDGGLTMAAVWSGAAELLLAAHGSAEQIEAARGAGRPSLALYEGFGRAPGEYRTTIVTVPAGVRVVGTKVAVAFGDEADPLVVVGQDPDTGGLRAVVTRVSTPGVDAAAPVGPLALGAGRLTEVRFDATIDASALVGGTEIAPAALLSSVQRIRLLLAAALVGTGQHAVDYAAQYATERIAFGKPIAGFQGVSFPLAEAHMRLDQSRLEVGLAAEALDAGAGPVNGAVDLAVSYASTAATEATRTAVQTLGGHGFMVDHPVERWYRTATALSAIDFDAALSPFTPAV
ncbi:acyl-CoA dehydrogenase family protein [Dactylosporangium sp. NPDC048998]|uniref:acyl-CoA dehydrogenase family protein n=1 Tax=Dactylosporangium sp. NPDC048998 TaxID=3363976 RepID=UPI00371C4A56